MVNKITKTKIIFPYLNNYEKSYYLRELSEKVGKPHQTVKKYAEKLTKEGVLIKNRRKKILEYSLNFKNPRTYDYLTIAEKEKLVEKIKENMLLGVLYEKLSPFFSSNTFVIFGSAAKGIKKGSDIDLLIIGKHNVSKPVNDFEKIYNKEIHVSKINNLKDLTLTIIKEIYKKHLILNNTEKIVRYLGELYEQNKLV